MSSTPTSLYERAPLTEEAAYYNRVPIGEKLKEFFAMESTLKPGQGEAKLPARVLEIASGSGQHAQYFVDQFPEHIVHIVPTEYDEGTLPQIAEVTKVGRELGRIAAPIQLDVCNAEHWEQEAVKGDARFDLAIVTNLTHIAPWEATVELMKGVRRKLKVGGTFFVYGPFLKDGKFTTDSNEQFDRWLKRKDASFGLRDIQAVADVAADITISPAGALVLEQVHEMPENNFMLQFRKVGRM